MKDKKETKEEKETKLEASGDKLKALKIALGQIEKNHGKGAIMKMGEATRMLLDVIPTGSISLDYALGIGGVPKGRIIEIFGPESSGKTTVCLHIVAEAQKRGGVAAYIDAENAMDPVYAKNLGVDVDNLLISQPDYGEQALDICETLVRSGAVDIIVIDSVAALVPKNEIEGEMGDQFMGLQARLMSQALRKLTAIVNKSSCVVVFVNQLREKIGVMFGNPETTPGGRALKFYSSVRLDVRRSEVLKDGENFLGNRVKVKVVKNKVAPPFKTAKFDILFGSGISREGDILDLGVELGVLEKSGSWLIYGESRWQGRDNACKFLRENPAVLQELENKVRAEIKPDTFDDTPQDNTSKDEKAAKKEAELDEEVVK
ncbi:MAG: recombinase RecA [Candidatus Margulisbacteria bacterium]|jgi:recombination protein RecA|nr:recombinase RecA [Candidatus Margulisiibacteriota bacterium]